MGNTFMKEFLIPVRQTLVAGISVLILSSGVILSNSLSAQDSGQQRETLPGTMFSVYQAYKDLQRFIWTDQDFLDADNDAEILDLIKILNSNFHAISSFEHDYEFDPAFEVRLMLVQESIFDAQQAFQAGKKDTALQQLKFIGNQCAACHRSFGIEKSFVDVLPPGLENRPEARAHFLLATRQFAAAKQAFSELAQSSREPAQLESAIYHWLVLEIREASSPHLAIERLESFLRRDNLPKSLSTILHFWMRSLVRWQSEPKLKIDTLRRAENLIMQGAALSRAGTQDQNEPGSETATGAGDIELLRGATLVHRVLDKPEITPEERRDALYLLGLAHSKLTRYFLYESPEYYLEQCIREFPQSARARQAFELYKDAVSKREVRTRGRSPSPEALLMFKELYDLMYKAPAIAGAV